MKHKLLLLAVTLLIAIQGYAQVSINTTGIQSDNSAMLDVSASDKGILIPRMTEIQRIAIENPATGLLVYQYDAKEGFYYFDGTAWVKLGSGIVTGVSGTTPVISSGGSAPVISIIPASTSTAGSMSASDKARLDGLVSSQWTSNGSNLYYNTGNVGIGLATPHAALQLSDEVNNRKIVLFEDENNEHEFYGFGINNYTLRYQTPASNASHVFYAGSSEITSIELFRIKGSGQIVIPALNTTGVLLNNASGEICSSIGTNGQVLSTDGGGGLIWATPYSGLTNFTESSYNYDSKTGVKFLATNVADNVDFIISPKGTGAILAQQPDGTTTGGNNRGINAVDLQRSREYATSVASGSFSTITGGQTNMAQGDYSSVVGGQNNSANSYGETVLGLNATSTDGTPGSFVPTDRLFAIGNGTGSSERSDAFTILKNANTTIGGSLTLNGNGTETSYTFPIERGTNGQVLSTDGSGISSWTTPATVTNLWENTGADVYRASGNVGIGVSSPHASLHLSDEVNNRKIVLFEDENNEHEFYGFGINNYTLRYQTPASNASHVFYSGASDINSLELFRIKGSGEIVIPALNSDGV